MAPGPRVRNLSLFLPLLTDAPRWLSPEAALPHSEGRCYSCSPLGDSLLRRLPFKDCENSARLQNGARRSLQEGREVLSQFRKLTSN